MHVVYCFPVLTSSSSGKNRATRQKIEAIEKISSNVRSFTLDDIAPPLRVAGPFFLEIMVLIYLAKQNKSIDYYIVRGRSQLFSVLLCKMIGIAVLREVHADIIDELPHLNKPALVKYVQKILSFRSYWIDRIADVRIFNNPLLKDYFFSKGISGSSDKYVYNGASLSAVSPILKKEAKEKYCLDHEVKYLVFTGSASFWHGVGYLVELQKCFNENCDNIQIVCAGGKVSDDLDSENVLINFSPLDERGCADIIKASDACLLPVNNVRISPGSPLKLYDYMANGAPVIAQENMPGYSDEVLKFSSGIVLDFSKPAEARDKILNFVQSDVMLEAASNNAKNSFENYSWNKRVSDWFS